MSENNGLDVGCGLHFRDDYERLDLLPIKFQDGKVYRIPMMPIEASPDIPEEGDLLNALDAFEDYETIGTGVKAMREAARGIVRAALGMVYKDVPDSLPIDIPTFRKVNRRLIGADASAIKNVGAPGDSF